MDERPVVRCESSVSFERPVVRCESSVSLERWEDCRASGPKRRESILSVESEACERALASAAPAPVGVALRLEEDCGLGAGPGEVDDAGRRTIPGEAPRGPAGFVKGLGAPARGEGPRGLGEGAPRKPAP